MIQFTRNMSWIPKSFQIPLRALTLNTTIQTNKLVNISKELQSLRLYRRFLRLTPFIQRSNLMKSYRSLLKLRFQEDYNQRIQVLTGIEVQRYTHLEMKSKAIKTLDYLNYILTYKSSDPVHLQFLQNYLRVHETKKDLFKQMLKKDPLVINSFSDIKGGILDGKNSNYSKIDMESYRDFERVLLMLNESEGLCL